MATSLCTRGTWQKWLRPFIQDPQPILALLETLKDDPDARVREQVAPDMRDIVKDYPEAGYATLERWGQDGKPETQKILRQALKYQVKIGVTNPPTSVTPDRCGENRNLRLLTTDC